MIKNITKIIALTILLTGVSFSAEQYTKVRAEHILVKTAAEAQQIKKAIDEGGSFEYYAKAYSLCPSGQRGGDLGYFEHGQMVPEFERAAFATPVGQVSKPIYSQFGWHLIKVIDKQ
jgi:peptidyl-prolyl cis-trans isomerase C